MQRQSLISVACLLLPLCIASALSRLLLQKLGTQHIIHTKCNRETTYQLREYIWFPALSLEPCRIWTRCTCKIDRTHTFLTRNQWLWFRTCLVSSTICSLASYHSELFGALSSSGVWLGSRWRNDGLGLRLRLKNCSFLWTHISSLTTFRKSKSDVFWKLKSQRFSLHFSCLQDRCPLKCSRYQTQSSLTCINVSCFVIFLTQEFVLSYGQDIWTLIQRSPFQFASRPRTYKQYGF